mmetsp:Transcript_9791/g.27720  ORF Transcript_9791/g.27720 Transcript_9791/m.27720 type:complete len:250 (-) Transcript_9791:65-814(-)
MTLSAYAICAAHVAAVPAALSPPSPRFRSRWYKSTTVIMPSSWMSDSNSPSSQSMDATGPGCAMPLASITMCSSSKPLRRTNSSNAAARSSFTLQHTHPFESSTNRVSPLSPPPPETPSRAINDSMSNPCPNSFSTTAMRLPPADLSKWFSSVVLPAPKNPVKMVTGTGADRGAPAKPSSAEADDVTPLPSPATGASISSGGASSSESMATHTQAFFALRSTQRERDYASTLLRLRTTATVTVKLPPSY